MTEKELYRYVCEALGCGDVTGQYCQYKTKYGPDTKILSIYVLTYLKSRYRDVFSNDAEYKPRIVEMLRSY